MQDFPVRRNDVSPATRDLDGGRGSIKNENFLDMWYLRNCDKSGACEVCLLSWHCCEILIALRNSTVRLSQDEANMEWGRGRVPEWCEVGSGVMEGPWLRYGKVRVFACCYLGCLYSSWSTCTYILVTNWRIVGNAFAQVYMLNPIHSTTLYKPWYLKPEKVGPLAQKCLSHVGHCIWIKSQWLANFSV